MSETDINLSFLPDEHQRAIAAVALRGGALDTTLEIVIGAALFAYPSVARFALKNLGNDRVTGLAKAVLIDTFPAEAEGIEEVFTKLEQAKSDRNEIIHWVWFVSNDGPDLAEHVSMRPFRQGQIKTKTADEIFDIAGRLFAAELAIGIWYKRILDPFHGPSRGKNALRSLPPHSAEPSKSDH